MDEAENIKNRVLGTRAAWLRQARLLLETPVQPEEFLRKRRELDELAVEAHWPRNRLGLPFPDLRGVFAAMLNVKTDVEQWRELESKLEEKEKKLLGVLSTYEATLTADEAMGFDGLRQKERDLSEYFDSAKLTDRQRDCASMIYEYGFTISETARRLGGLDRKTVDEHIKYAKKKLENNEEFKRRLKRRAARGGSHDQEN